MEGKQPPKKGELEALSFSLNSLKETLEVEVFNGEFSTTTSTTFILLTLRGREKQGESEGVLDPVQS
jgi:hypothetical protein